MPMVAVFCGSRTGNNPTFTEAAKAFGQCLVKRGYGLVYGGGNVGLMGVIADSVLDAGGDVIGVIPEHLKSREVAHGGLTELHVVKDMHERKALMAELAHAFVAMPGGIGTLEEIFEAWTWAQLGYHHKPCAFFNVDGFFDPLLQLIEQMVENEFLAKNYAEMIIKKSAPDEILEAFETYAAPQEKWR